MTVEAPTGDADLTGQRFGQWTVLRFSHRANRQVYWICKCTCDNRHLVMGSKLKSGQSTRCTTCARKKHRNTWAW